MSRNIFLFPAFLAHLLITGCGAVSTSDIECVDDFELSKYMGVWYETARYDHVFERGMTGVSAEYSMRDDGLVRVLNSGYRDGRRKSVEGVARFMGPSDRGELEVSFFRPFYGDYRIIALADDYSSAVVTGSTRDYLWILSRTEVLPENVLQDYFLFLREKGFDTGKLIISESQTPEKTCVK